MTEYTRRQLRKVTREALAALAADKTQDPVTRDQALAAAQLGHREPRPDLREPYVCRFGVQPGLWLTVDASHNIMLEVRTPDESELLAAYALSSAGELAQQLGLCRIARDAAVYDAEQARLQRLGEVQALGRLVMPRDGEDAESRIRAAEILTDLGLLPYGAEQVLKRAYGHSEASATEDTGTLARVAYDRDSGCYVVMVPRESIRRRVRPGLVTHVHVTDGSMADMRDAIAAEVGQNRSV